jgi:peptidoglycan LD-endopeptidase LytH
MSKIRWPLVRNVIRKGKVSNTYGTFSGRIKGGHWGWDFYAKYGTPCYAIADGFIELVYGNVTDRKNFGLAVVLRFEFNGKNLYAAYCHLSASSVDPHTTVKAGDVIGFTGNSGNAFNMKGDDEHLHFEVRTSPRPGPGGLPGRISPLGIFGRCPLREVIVDTSGINALR